jgi:hypothetical protein
LTGDVNGRVFGDVLWDCGRRFNLERSARLREVLKRWFHKNEANLQKQAMEMTGYGKHGKPKTAFHPSHTSWKSLRDSHITTASATTIIHLKPAKAAAENPQPKPLSPQGSFETIFPV